MRTLVALLLGVAALCSGQYTVWRVESVYSGFNCSGIVTAQLSTPISVIDSLCVNGTVECTLRDESAALYPSVWQQVSCSPWTPETAFSYRTFLASPGDGLCESFEQSWAFLPTCESQLMGNGTTVYVMPVCYENQTTLQAFSDPHCSSSNSTLWSVNTQPQWTKCSRDLDDNQTFYLTTCPQMTARGVTVFLSVLTLFTVLVLSL